MASRLIRIDKKPGVRPVGTGDTWRFCMEKCILAVAIAEDKDACGTEQLCDGLKAGIKGGIYATQILWK